RVHLKDAQEVCIGGIYDLKIRIGFDYRNQLWRQCFDEVYLAGLQHRDACRSVVDDDVLDLVYFCLIAPVVVVSLYHDVLSFGPADETERPGTDRMPCHFAAELLYRCGAGYPCVADPHQEDEGAVWAFQVEPK